VEEGKEIGLAGIPSPFSVRYVDHAQAARRKAREGVARTGWLFVDIQKPNKQVELSNRPRQIEVGSGHRAR
jgi:hypothetical protein